MAPFQSEMSKVAPFLLIQLSIAIYFGIGKILTFVLAPVV